MIDLIVNFKSNRLRVETADGHPYTITYENGNWFQLEKLENRPSLRVVDKNWKGPFLSAAELKEVSDAVADAEKNK